MNTKCLAMWHKTDFGKSLDKECHGCTRRVMFGSPLSAAVKAPLPFGDKCPLKVEEKK